MARFYKVTIGTIHLTSTGAAGGIDCKLSVEGVEDLLTSVAGIAIPSITGSPVFQTIPWTSGKQFDVRIETHLYLAEWNALKELLNDSLENGTSFNVTGTGDIGDFNVTARAFPQKPFAASGFTNGRIERAVFRLITV
jgi:hypothetical protein